MAERQWIRQRHIDGRGGFKGKKYRRKTWKIGTPGGAEERKA